MPQPIKGRKRRQRFCVHIHTIQTLMRSLGASARPAGFFGIVRRNVYSWLGRDYKEWSTRHSVENSQELFAFFSNKWKLIPC